MIGVGVIGYGYWGPKVLRALAATSGCRVVMVSDLLSERLRAAQAEHPTVGVSTNARDLLRDPRIDAVVIAAPVPTHFVLAQAALAAGKHVFVEKPVTATLAEARRLVDEVERRQRVLMVDHTFVYAGAVRRLRELLAGEAGAPTSYESVRANCGARRDDVNVIWDLAVHDLSIMDLVMPSSPCAIAATATTRPPGSLEDAAQLRVWFSGSLEAQVEVDWLGASRARCIRVGGSQRTIVYDDCEALEKLRVYDHADDAPEARRGTAMPFDLTEPLRVAAEHFVRCIEAGTRPASDIHAGLRMVGWLDAATRSARAGGRPVELSSDGAAS